MTEPERKSSGTAQGVAWLRAAHQLIDGEPPILDDPIIVRLFGPYLTVHVRADLERLQSPQSRGLRSHIVLRSRFAEDALADAVREGARQYVLLGAGLDTFAYRQPEWAHAIEIVEVDHPASQQSKHEALIKAGITVPSNVRYADVDFERETLADGLRRCAVSSTTRSFFSWLGVTMYLTGEAIDAVLATVVGFPKGSTIVLTFAQPREEGDSTALADGAAAMGEPWLSYFTPAELEAVLRGHGFSEVRFPMREALFARYFADRRDGLLPPRRNSICMAVV
ncbi:MAG TPA: class I SAM-dependent methyltransferase [Gemmatimonadaceae bacterium]